MWIEVCERLFNFSSLGLKGSECEKCEVAVDPCVFLAANCTEDAVYRNKSEDVGYEQWFLCEGTMEVR